MDNTVTTEGAAMGKRRYEVKVWFATSATPRVVAVCGDKDAALREARAYLSDARGVWVNDERLGGR